MAEAIVSTVVQTLGTLLIPEAISFITSFTGVHEQFRHLREEFVSIQGFLSTADSNHNQDPGIRAWVSDVRDIAYDVEDVIDTYLLKVAYYEEGESSFERYAHKPKKLLDCHKLNKKMDNLLSELKHISERRKRYD
ncbi:Disease resistance protein, partial [Thalictrum thalictroides]